MKEGDEMKTWINVFVTLSLLLSSVGFNQPALAYVPLSPQTSLGQETAPTATPEATPTPTPTATFDYGAYPPPITSTPQLTETPIVPSPTPDLGDSGVIPTPIPEESSEDDPLGLSAIANPAIYIPGKPVYIFWNLTGQNQIMEGSNVQIRVRFPDVPASESADVQSDERELILPVTDPQGVIPWEINERVDFPLYVILDLLVDDILIDTEVIEIGLADFEIGNLDGGTAEGLGGKVRVEVPFDALEESAYFSVRYPSPNKLPSVSLTGNPIEIIAVGKDSGGYKVCPIWCYVGETGLE